MALKPAKKAQPAPRSAGYTSRTPRPAQTRPALVAPVTVQFKRKELVDMLDKYNLVNDCITGSTAVKAKRQKYLPMPNPEDTSPSNQTRYEAYITRAVFYNVGQGTLKGFVGSVFEVDPVINVPTLIDPVVKDADGSGVSLVQLAQKSETAVLANGRAGLRIDFPESTGPVTRKDQTDGKVRPTIHHYEPTSIINWRTKIRGNKTVLSLVVLEENYEKYDVGGFAVQPSVQYRVLRLDENDVYRQELWKVVNGMLDTVPKVFTPLDSKGAFLNELPFTFIGAVDNSVTIDEPPMFPLCDLNIAHYRNSADYEESVYITGQSTPVVSGIDQHWYKEIMKERINFGSRGGIALPTGAKAELLEMVERTAAFAAMEHKEKQMVALGAKLVETKQVQRTATETSTDAANETSILRTVTDNVSAAYRFALEWCTIFAGERTVFTDAKTAGDDKNAVVFSLNTDFNIATASPEEVNSAINAWQKEAITYTEMRTVLKRAKLATQDDKVAKAEIQSMRMDDGDTDPNTGLPIPRSAPIVTAGDE